MFNVIVVGTDGSATANAAVKRAGEIAEMTGARIELVGGFRESYGFATGMGADTYPANLAEDARQAANGCVEDAAARLRSGGLEVETHCIPGDAADALVDVAETTEADLIVVGSKGMQGGKRFLLGSVPNRVSHHAPCSVMIVRTT
jgi:nucleotide-binding universal stress UspA family protein